MARFPSCPRCNEKMHPGDFLCPVCELIVDGTAVEDHPEPPRGSSVVRALLAPPERSLVTRPPAPPPAPPPSADARRSTTKTRVFTLAAGKHDVPIVVMGVDPRGLNISSFEARVVSLIDGVSTVEELGRKAGLQVVELQSVLHTLVARQIVAIHEVLPARPKADEPRPAPAAVPKAPAGRPRPEPPRGPPPVLVRGARAAPKPAPVRPSPKPPKPADPAPPADGAPELSGVELARLLRDRARPAPADPGEHLLQKAIRLEGEGNVDEAISVLEWGISRAASPGPLYNRLALALVKERRDFRRAEELLRKALEKDPENEVYSQNLMRVVMMAAAVTGKRKVPRPRR